MAKEYSLNYLEQRLVASNFSPLDSHTHRISYPTDMVSGQSQQSDVHSFRQQVEQWNADRIIEVMSVLKKMLAKVPSEQVTVLLEGSDARREKGPYSPMEFSILAENSKVAQEVVAQLKKLNCLESLCRSEFCNKKKCPHTFDTEHIEVKLVGASLLSGYEGSKKHVWPDRVLSGQIVFGSFTLLERARQQVLDEMNSQSDLKKPFRRNGARFKQVTMLGQESTEHKENQPPRHFDFSTGQLFFNPALYQGGTKYGPVRYLQFLLTKAQIEKNEVWQDPHTHNRLERYGLEPSKQQQISDAYYFSLLQYHRLQYAYGVNLESNGVKATVQTEAVLLKNACLALLSLS